MHNSTPSFFHGQSFCLPILICLMGLASGTSLLAADYQLVWSDEFEVDGLPDSSKWDYDVGGWGWGNSELQYYTEAQSKNARVEGGYLIIEAHEETIGNNNYTSARLLTEDLHEFEYGRFEARVKVPAGAGLWPAFWMLGNDFSEVGWPYCGEIDIMEFVGREPYEIFGTIHGPGYSAGGSFGNTITLNEPVPDAFHTYAIEWEPEEIRWYMDDTLYHTATPADLFGLRTQYPWVFDHPFFMILNLAVGGTFGGFLDPNLEFPVQMQVDYVRVYQEDLGIFNNYPRDAWWVDTGDYLGWAYVEHFPWVWLDKMGAYIYAPSGADGSGQWLHFHRPSAVQ